MQITGDRSRKCLYRITQQLEYWAYSELSWRRCCVSGVVEGRMTRFMYCMEQHIRSIHFGQDELVSVSR